MSYLSDLLDRIAAAAADLPQTPSVAEFLRRAQHDDGGWRGRSGASDPYWTAFALRCACVVGIRDEPFWHRAAQYVLQAIGTELGFVDATSLLLTVILIRRIAPEAVPDQVWHQCTERLVNELERARHPSGGYRKSRVGRDASTYATFLAHLCYGELGQAMPRRDAAVQFLLSRQQPDGGFFEVRPGKPSGTNPTAAAVVVLAKERAFDREQRQRAAEFLFGVRSPAGGFCANRSIPLPDLLSTFTALAALDELGTPVPPTTLSQTEKFARSLLRDDGGFSAAPWDLETDPEYTFYGIGSLALARLMHSTAPSHAAQHPH